MTVDEYRALYVTLGLEPMRGGFLSYTACCPLTAHTMGILGTRPTSYLDGGRRNLQEDIRLALGVNEAYIAGFIIGLDAPNLGSTLDKPYNTGYEEGRAVRPLFGLDP